MVDPTNVYTSKTGLCISAFTSECHIKGKWLHICWVEGVMLGNHEKRELREGGLCLLETQRVWWCFYIFEVLSCGHATFNIVALWYRARNCR